MDRITNILAIVDPTSTEQPAVQKAATLALQLGARLELLACDTREARETRAAAQVARGAKQVTVTLEPLVKALAHPLRERGLDVTTHCTWQDPLHAGLCDWVRHSSVDMVVKDTHHHSLAKRTFVTNTDWHLIRELPLPLLFTKPKPWAGHPVVAAAIDPTHANDKPLVLDHFILEHAQSLAQALQGELHTVHAYFPAVLAAALASASSPPTFITIPPNLLQREEEEKRAELQAITRPYGVQAAHVHFEMSVPSEYIPRAAEQCGADLLVMGAIARSGLKRVFIGSTAERVLEWLPCDALIVKSPDFAKSLPL